MSSSRRAAAYIVGAKRTPFGAFGGSLKSVSAVQLGTAATKAALSSGSNLTAEAVTDCYFGNVIQTGNDAAYLARHIALQSGCAISTPALTLNRLCGSGFETVCQAYNAIQLAASMNGNSGKPKVILAGGTEQMSQAPLAADGVRWGGVPLGQGLQLRDVLWDGLTDAYAGMPMGITAENLAKQYNISRTECDEYAVQSQQRYQHGNERGVFQAEMAPVTVPASKKGGNDTLVDADEHPRPETDLDKIAKLRPVFIKDTGVVTAANASGICDGAGCIVVASEEAVQHYQLQPLVRVVSCAVTGCDPTIMGIGPVEAIRTALKQAGLTLADMSYIEINEAFAAQFLACAKELQLDMSITNVHGGAISVGHPLAASGSRITAHLTHLLASNKDDATKQYAIGAACIGGGQGIAVILERC